jgi:hypothetical protein
MKGDIELSLFPGQEDPHFRHEDICYEWPEDRAIGEDKREYGLREFVIDKLDIQISVQLQPYCSPTMALAGSADGSNIPPRPMMVWVIDINTTTRGKPEPSPSPTRSKPAPRRTADSLGPLLFQLNLLSFSSLLWSWFC